MAQETQEKNEKDSSSPETNGDKNKSQEKGKEGNDEKSKQPADPRKKRRTLVLGGIVALVAIIVGVSWYLYSQTYETTDDANIDGHINVIAARISGTITGVYVENNQAVKAGEVLVDLDPKDYEVSLAQSEAELRNDHAQYLAESPNLPITQTSNNADILSGKAEVANADSSLAAAERDYDQASFSLRQVEATNAKAQSDLARYTQLIEKREIAQSDFDQYASTAKAQAASVEASRSSLRAAEKVVEQRRAQLKQQEARLQQSVFNAPRQITIRRSNVVSKQAVEDTAMATVRQNHLNLSYCKIASPVTGLVSSRSTELGARISAGQQLMMIVQTDNLWVTANFKETQLGKMRPGQHVSIYVDTLSVTFDGYIESMPSSTGSVTSVLPPDNATGNFVKVVQRLPVRIRFNPNQPGMERLRNGMSVEPKVHF